MFFLFCCCWKEKKNGDNVDHYHLFFFQFDYHHHQQKTTNPIDNQITRLVRKLMMMMMINLMVAIWWWYIKFATNFPHTKKVVPIEIYGTLLVFNKFFFIQIQIELNWWKNEIQKFKIDHLNDETKWDFHWEKIQI